MSITMIESKIEGLASEVIPARYLPSFHLLPLKDQIFGISVFAASGKDTAMVYACEALLLELDCN